MSKHWQLPDGVDELLPPLAQAVEELRRLLLNLFSGWGYQLVSPPMLEFLDERIVNGDEQLMLSTLKVTDQISGRMLGLRTDFSSQVARMDAHSLPSTGTQRLCYAGDALLARPSAAGEGRCPIKAGAEIYGYSGSAADIEILMLLHNTLETAAAPAFHIELGHTEIYRALVAPLGLTPEQDRALFEALQSKACADLAQLLAAYGAPEKARAWLTQLPTLVGDESALERARQCFVGADPAVITALEQLETILVEMKQRLPGVAVTFDLAEVRGYHYHAGALYTAYVDDLGLPVAKGGRYDGRGEAFGRRRAATGFDIDLVALAKLVQTQIPPSPTVLIPWLEATDPRGAALGAKVKKLRAEGVVVVPRLPEDAVEPATSPQLVWQDASNAWELDRPLAAAIDPDTKDIANG